MSMRCVDQQTGEEIPDERGGGDGGGGGRGGGGGGGGGCGCVAGGCPPVGVALPG